MMVLFILSQILIQFAVSRYSETSLVGFVWESAAKIAAALKNLDPNLENCSGWFLSYNMYN